MPQKFILILFFSLLILIPGQVNAQGIEKDTISFRQLNENSHDFSIKSGLKPCYSVYLELAGKGLCSFNIDYRKKETSAISLGIVLFTEGFEPNLMYYRFVGDKRWLEIGGGLSANVFSGPVYDHGILVHGVLGYRYQKKKGLIFRIGLTPFINFRFNKTYGIDFVPLYGLSIGYSF